MQPRGWRQLRSAESWLKRCEAAIRDERFESVKAQVTDVWETLAVGSNVTLEDVRLGTKKVVMDVTVDGDSSVALGVMSQGETACVGLEPVHPESEVRGQPVQVRDPRRPRAGDGPGAGRRAGSCAAQPGEDTSSCGVHPRRPALDRGSSTPDSCNHPVGNPSSQVTLGTQDLSQTRYRPR